MNATLEAPQISTAMMEDLILARHLTPKTTPSDVRKDIGKLLAAKIASADFENFRHKLASDGFLTVDKRKKHLLTEVGRQRVLRFLGLSELPAEVSWGIVVDRYLFTKATGLSAEAAAKLNSANRLKPYILKREFRLASTSLTTVNQVLEAITCQALGYPQETTLKGLLEAVLSEQVESDERLTKAQLETQLPLFKTGLSQFRADSIRRILVREWLAKTESVAEGDEPVTEPFDLSAFAATVLKLAANSPPEDRFHDNKVFIAPLWRASQHESNFPRLSLQDFKEHLVEANARHFLHLSRADLVQAMDQQLVKDSKTEHLNATFHFVLLQEIGK